MWGHVRVEPVGSVQLRGRSEPITTYRALGLATQGSLLETRGDRPFARFVGRKKELAVLGDLLSRAEMGQGGVLGVVGEPGIGKSRLLFELRRGLTQKNVAYLEGHCVSYGSAIPYLPVLGFLRRHGGITDTDTPEIIADKVRRMLSEAEIDPADSAPYLFHLLGVKEGAGALGTLRPETIRAKILETITRLIGNTARRRPLLLVVEDLQWIDRSSEDLLTSLIESLPSMPILMVVTYRPGYRLPWVERSHGGAEMTLGVLPPPESRAVVESIFGVRPPPEDIAQLILGKAEGNPLFIEELSRSLVEHPEVDPTLVVPDTLQGLLMERIDRLPDDVKHLLQVASVIGREVGLPLLRAIWDESADLDSALHELRRLEFLHEYPGGGVDVYTFRHALTQDVAYARLLDVRRRIHHEAVGHALEDLYAARMDEITELLAHHFGHSGAVEKAVDYALLAAEKAQRRC